MKIRLVRSPTEAFLEMPINNGRPLENKPFEGIHWGAVGLVQAKLIELYWAADVAEMASNVRTALVMGAVPSTSRCLPSSATRRLCMRSERRKENERRFLVSYRRSRKQEP